MTYTEWRDELKSNLLCVSQSEQKRVLKYYAEAYADRREAGYSEREIIEQFGAPYDAAQRILNEDGGAYAVPERKERREEPPRPAPVRDEYFSEPPRVYEVKPCAKEEKREKRKSKGKTSWVFILLCIIFAIPIFGIILALSAITVAAFIAPFAILIAGIGEIGLGVGTLFTSVPDGLMRVGAGLILFGIGVILISVLPRIAKLFWTFFKKVGGFIKSLFTAEEA